MKKLATLLFLGLALASAHGQSPSGFNYQAVIRSGSGEILSNQNISLRIQILADSPSGTLVWSETYSETTNDFGLVNVVVGSSPSNPLDVNTIDPSGGIYFIETAVDLAGGSNFTVLGASQLMSVPYALYASKAEEEDGDPENELQEISTDDTPGNIGITAGSTLTLNVDDADADETNEIQDLELIGNTLRLTGNTSATEIFLGGQNFFGDIKHSFISGDHAGWFLLDGRSLNNLPETAKQNATDLGFVDFIPDARDRFLKGNLNESLANLDETAPNGYGNNFLLIAKENIPDYQITGNTAIDGFHSHGYERYPFYAGAALDGGSNFLNYSNRSATTIYQTSNAQSTHSHAIDIPSGGSGAPINNQPSYLVTNVFIYLGGLTLGDLQDLGQTNQEILDAGISPNALWADNNDILNDLLGLTYQGQPITLQTFVDEGISLSFLYGQYANTLLDETSVTTLDLYQDGVTIAEMDANFLDATTAITAMRTDGISIEDIFASGLYSLQQLADGGFTILELLVVSDYATIVSQGVATYQEFLDAGETPLEIWTVNNGVLDDLLGLNYNSSPITLQTFVDETIPITFLYVQYANDLLSQTTVNTLDLYTAGVSLADMDANGVGLAVFVADGIGISDLNESGLYTLSQLEGQFDAASMLTIADVTLLLSETTISIVELRAGGALAEDFHGVPYQGGLIFYTLADGTTYVAEDVDQSSGINWGIDGGVATGNQIGDGQSNTANIVAFDPGENAANLCNDLIDGEGFSDWYLPSKNELKEMYDNLKAKQFGDFTNAFYWSSSAPSNSRGDAVDFSNGTFASGSTNRERTNLYRVRAIRSFTSVPD